MYISVPFKGQRLHTENSIEASSHIRNQFPNNTVHGVAVCAFGIVHTFYIDNEKHENYNDWSMENQCGVILYFDEDNTKIEKIIERERKNYIPSKVI